MRVSAMVLVLLLALGAGCMPSEYYRIKDVGSGVEYVTPYYETRGFTNTITFRDISSGRVVNLQAYEIERISAAEASAYGPPSR